MSETKEEEFILHEPDRDFFGRSLYWDKVERRFWFMYVTYPDLGGVDGDRKV